MEHSASLPGSPAGSAPLQPMSADRVNQISPLLSSVRSDHQRDSSIHDKISQFNLMSQHGPNSALSMTRQLERKTADAALKRAMMGREAAESEMRRHREEVRVLRKQVEDGRERERKVAERLESVVEQYGRAKEHHSHTQALWEKEIRRARKETFKSQSSTVKLQEELKAAKVANKSNEELLEREKERSKAREQEAFAARYQLVGVQEQLQQALDRIKVIEQERDAFKMLAQNEEVARIAAEGRLPLPQSDKEDDEFDSPKKARVSLSTTDVTSSAASEAEIDELTRLWQWEKQRADRTQDHLEFLEAECSLRCCPCAKSRSRRSNIQPGSARKQRSEPVAIVDPADLVILGQSMETREQPQSQDEDTALHKSLIKEAAKEIKVENSEPRRSTIFVPSEGIFRTLSQQDMDRMNTVDETNLEPLTLPDPLPETSHYARTPSVDPPAFALMAQERTSLCSLLNAPRQSDQHHNIMNIPTTPANTLGPHMDLDPADEIEEIPAPTERPVPQPSPRPHTSADFYGIRTTTTSVPIRDENFNPHAGVKPEIKAHARAPSFDVNNPALTPTMTREQALAQIRARRGRARSAAQGALTPRKQMVTGGLERRDVSAPAGRAVRGKS